jgi:hypothetical protein
MKLIWTKSASPLSVLIRWALNEPCSHVAIVFDNKLVFHSNLLGLHIEWFNTFKKKVDIVFEKEYSMSLEQEEAIYQKIIDKEDGKYYDFRAFAYFAWRALLRKFFKIPLPSENKWQSVSADMCVEAIRYLDGIILVDLPEDKALAMITPYQLSLILAAQRPTPQGQ